MSSTLKRRESDGVLLGSISRAVVQIVHEYTGRGPTEARTSICDDVVVVLLRHSLLPAERSLIRDDKAQAVVDLRRSFQEMMREDLSEAVARLTQRDVLAFMSDTNLGSDCCIDVFVLAPIEAEPER